MSKVYIYLSFIYEPTAKLDSKNKFKKRPFAIAGWFITIEVEIEIKGHFVKQNICRQFWENQVVIPKSLPSICKTNDTQKYHELRHH